MIDDQVRHQIHLLPQFFDIFPTAQGGIDFGMVNRIKAGIGAVDWDNRMGGYGRRQTAPPAVPLATGVKPLYHFRPGDLHT